EERRRERCRTCCDSLAGRLTRIRPLVRRAFLQAVAPVDVTLICDTAASVRPEGPAGGELSLCKMMIRHASRSSLALRTFLRPYFARPRGVTRIPVIRRAVLHRYLRLCPHTPYALGSGEALA